METINGYPYYLDKFFIALYTSDDELIAIADNPRDLCSQMGLETTENNLSNVRAKLRRSRTNGTLFNYRGYSCEVFLIPVYEPK